MEKLTIVWEKPFKFSQRIRMVGAIGVYVLEVGSKIYYVGKAEEKGYLNRVGFRPHHSSARSSPSGSATLRNEYVLF